MRGLALAVGAWALRRFLRNLRVPEWASDHDLFHDVEC